mgnify:FL=1
MATGAYRSSPSSSFVRRPDCAVCDHNYRATFRALTPDVPNLAVYDIDLVMECNSHIFGLGEWKRSRTEYQEYLYPAFEYMGIKKFGKLLRVPPYLMWEIVGADKFLIWKIDRFERDREFMTLLGKNGQMAVFSPDDALVVNRAGFAEWLRTEIEKDTAGGSA